MAVAGLQNLSEFGPSFYGEHGNTTRQASPILQMWREMEGDHLVTHSPLRSKQQKNDSTSECLSITTSLGQGSDNGHDSDDNNSVISELSSDFGETEHVRLRQQNYQENSKSHSSNRFNLGPQRFGENINRHSEIGKPRRPIRRLCGRQTLLDLLLRAQTERSRDLQVLSERRPVSDFAHRNRIHALLRGRFLRNERLIPDERPSCKAATELDLLRQRPTVSGLREGFLSKLDNSASTSMNHDDSDSSNEHSGNTENLTVLNLENDVESNEHSGNTENLTVLNLENDSVENTSQQETDVQTLEDPVLPNDGSEQEFLPSTDFESVHNREEIIINFTNDSILETEDMQSVLVTEASLQEADAECATSRHGEEITNNNTNDSLFGRADSEHIIEFEGGPNDENNFHIAPPTSVIEIEDSGAWLQLNSVAYTERVDGNREDTSLSWFNETSSNDDAVEHDQIQESNEEYWSTHNLQEANDNWLNMPSAEVGSSLGRVDSFYFPDDADDNFRTVELRELFSRRRVSSLLRSGFRESLDQVLQSHVERLVHASGDWEMDNISSSHVVEQDPELLNGERALGQSDGADRNPFAPTSTHVPAYEPLWDDNFQDANWPHNLRQQFGMEWEGINELRIDIAMLHQRMDNMQSMLEACMDMQIELQRTVRQEVSAALNRSNLSLDADVSQGSATHDEFQWDQVRKGICCLCSERNIDSLLYRCGHMCTCSKCAEKLVQLIGKCPMCRAPVVEAVRAYFTQ